MNLQDTIQSIQQSLKVDYARPAPLLVDKYRKCLADSSSALDYLQITRGFNAETLENFKIGYDPERDAITIPVYKRGELINIRYRYLNPSAPAKYTSEKGCEVWIYNEDGIARGKSKGGILVTEGEFDCMSAWQAGFKNVVSPASGKDSYGIWLELLDTIPKVYIAYDNDRPGKQASLDLAERVGTDKSYEVLYPEGIKDANDYFKAHSSTEYRDLIKNAKPFYKHKYKDLGSVIEELKLKGDSRMMLDLVPFTKFGNDFMAVVSGDAGLGKTTYVMNLANELATRGIPCLVLPFERGIKTVGTRFLQIKFNKTEDELIAFDDADWDKHIPEIINLPLYFSLPDRKDIKQTILKAKRLFGVKVVLIDHLDYNIIDTNNEVSEMKRVLLEWKNELCIENELMFFVVHHIKKPEGSVTVKRKPRKEDLKGGSSSYQIPEVVILLSEPDSGLIEVDVVKNKNDGGGSKIYEFKKSTGVIGRTLPEVEKPKTAQQRLDDEWKT